MKFIEAQAFIGQPLEGRRFDGATERGGCTKADVVYQHDHDVGSALGRFDLKALGFGRVTGILFCNDYARWGLNGQHSAVHLVRTRCSGRCCRLGGRCR